MPYSKDKPPKQIKGLPKKAQAIWIEVFNEAFDEYDPEKHDAEDAEAYGNAIAWTAVKKAGYQKNKKGKWVKEESMQQNVKTRLEKKLGKLRKLLEGSTEESNKDHELLGKLVEAIASSIDSSVISTDEKAVEALEKHADCVLEQDSPVGSFEWLRDILQAAIREDTQFCEHMDDRWIKFTFPDKMIVSCWQCDQLWSADYSFVDDGLELSNIQELQVQYVPKETRIEMLKSGKILQLLEQNELEKEKQSAGSGAPESTTRRPILERIQTTLEVLEQDTEKLASGIIMKVKGAATKAEQASSNGTMYSRAALEKGVAMKKKEIPQGAAVSLVDHPITDEGNLRPVSITDIGIKLTDVFMEDDVVQFEGGIVDTQKGRDLAAIARAGIPIDISTRIGPKTWETIKKEDGEYEYITDVYSFDFDAVYGGAMENMGIKEVLEQQREKEEEMDMKKILEQLEKLNSRIETLETQGNSQELLEFKALRNELKAKKRIKEVLESEELKTEFGETHSPKMWQPVLERQLSKAKSAEEVDQMLPVVKATYLETLGLRNQEPGSAVIEVKEPGLFGDKGRPSTIQEGWDWMTDKLKGSSLDKGSEKWVFERLLSNYLNFQAGEARIMRGLPAIELRKDRLGRPMYNERGNFMKHLLMEAAGDSETITSDIDASQVAALALFRPVFERLIALELVSTQPIDRPSGKAFFLDYIYEDTDDSKVSAGVDSDYADKAELAEAANLVLLVKSNDISLDTAKKLRARWTVESEQDVFAYHRINIDSEMMQAMRDEIAREINAVILADMLTGTSPSNSDNKATAGNVNFNTTPDPDWDIDKWWEKKLAWTRDDACALVYNEKFVEPNFAIGDRTAIGYLKRLGKTEFEPVEGPDINVGIRRVGTLAGSMRIYAASGFTANKLLLGYKGTEWLRTGYVFLPYILFYVGDLIHETTLSKKRAVMSRFAKQKTIGGVYSTITFV